MQAIDELLCRVNNLTWEADGQYFQTEFCIHVFSRCELKVTSQQAESIPSELPTKIQFHHLSDSFVG